MSCNYYSDWSGYPDGLYTAPPDQGGVPCSTEDGGYSGGSGNSGGYGGGSNQVPVGVGNAGGWPGGQSGGTQSNVINSILSGIALLTHQNYVPTPLQSGQTPYGATGQQPPVYYNPNSNALGNTNLPKQNAFGGIQQYIQQHPQAMLFGGLILVAFLMKPPVMRRNGLRRRRR